MSTSSLPSSWPERRCSAKAWFNCSGRSSPCSISTVPSVWGFWMASIGGSLRLRFAGHHALFRKSVDDLGPAATERGGTGHDLRSDVDALQAHEARAPVAG